jgi:hypothetical protein
MRGLFAWKKARDAEEFRKLKSADPPPLEERLELDYYDAADCTGAIRAETLPLALGHPLTGHYVIREIRYNRDGGFAAELYGLPGAEEFTRALNARRIMSNAIRI